MKESFKKYEQVLLLSQNLVKTVEQNLHLKLLTKSLKYGFTLEEDYAVKTYSRQTIRFVVSFHYTHELEAKLALMVINMSERSLDSRHVLYYFQPELNKFNADPSCLIPKWWMHEIHKDFYNIIEDINREIDCV